MKWWRILRRALRVTAIAVLIGVGFHYRDALLAAAQHALGVGWLALWLLPLFWIWNLAAARGWRALALTMYGEGSTPSTLRLALVRIEAQAVNLALPTAGLSGEVIKATLTGRDTTGVGRAAAAVALDDVASLGAGMLFCATGLSLAGALGRGWALLPAMGLILLAGALLQFVPVVVLAIGRGDSKLANALNALSLEDRPDLRHALSRGIAWHLLERALTAGEIWLVAVGLGASIGPLGALFATAMMTGFTLLLFFVPAHLGVAEGGLSLAFVEFGWPSTLGLSVGLVRRARQVVVLAVGLVLLLVFERRGSQGEPTGTDGC